MNPLPHLQPGKKAESAGLPPDSMLGLAYERRSWKKDGLVVPTSYYYDILAPDGKTVLDTVQNIEVIIDIGNNEAKIALWDRNGVLITRGTTTTLQTLKSAIYSTSDAPVWQQRFYDDYQAEQYRREQLDGKRGELPIQYSDDVYIGDNATEALVTGPTDARFSQAEYLLFLRICIAEALEVAGYYQENPFEEKNVGLCIGVRNEETAQGQGLKPEVKLALDELLGPVTLIKTVGERPVERKLHIREYSHLPQSWGAIYALDTDIMGNAGLVETDAITGFDGGWFDIHLLEGVRVGKGKGMRVKGEKIENIGGVFLARELANELRKTKNFPQLGVMSDAEAREALRTGTFKLGGRKLKDGDAEKAQRIITHFKDTNGTKLIAGLASRHPRLDSLFLFYGGLFINLHDQIVGKMTDLLRPQDFYMTLPYDDETQLPKFANVIGLAGLYNLKNRKKALR
ncbi:hypothetical protein KSF_108250 [Reticulibacter mediterranei]|uniref:Uncharacterized protein n=1 Tax=Reticulibacter mediterranei TaxID=2778369 RepID=A0A8J3N6V3_9CHLR|nr:hypothetical protein [Reticulibacter mediterranei]GHP00778.1 hypothetical protein KSF_108250 [Reticulibacter mediterranei]